MKTYRMPAAKRIDVEESEDFVALEDLEGRDVTCSTKRTISIMIPARSGGRGNSNLVSKGRETNA